MKDGKTRDLLEMMQIIGGDDPERKARLDVIRHQHRIAQELYALRQQKGLTQAELARLVGTSQSTIARVEKGTGHPPTLSTLVKVGLALGQELHLEYTPRKRGRTA